MIKKLLKYCLLFLVVLTLACLCVPIPNLDMDYSKVLLDKDGQLLSAKISSDEQWRFPIEGNLPKQLEESILLFEDAHFYKHFGINPISIIKAAIENKKAKRIVRGGSTITMQVMRMYRGNQKRTYGQKVIEILGAIKLEMFHSKKDILKMWASIAPFGGNTVGASTAAWKFYQRPLSDLSIAEYATLAVLPNAPSSMHMTKNVDKLVQKRNRLLKRLLDRKKITEDEYQLALFEDISFAQSPLPMHSLHLLDYLSQAYPKKNIFQSTIDRRLQVNSADILQSFSEMYQHDGIDNAALIIIDHHKNEVVSYLGNTRSKDGTLNYVDCSQAPRSYGSLLKPFLYAYAIDEGFFLPNELVKDIPTSIQGFNPMNFDKQFRGSVPLHRIISHSLNVPAVRTLNYVGAEEFHEVIKFKLKFEHINPDYGHHGLSLILGGAEANLIELTNSYKGLLRNYFGVDKPYGESKFLQNQNVEVYDFFLHPTAVEHTINAMQSVNRPVEEQNFAKISGQKIAWKTGTSYGHRDAWSIGANGRYVVGVWIGNENGTGIHKLTGGIKAAPVLFKVFRQLESDNEFSNSSTNGKTIEVCKESGRAKGRFCTSTTYTDVPFHSHRLRHCNHHSINFSGETSDTIFAMTPTEEYYKAKFSGIIERQTPSKKDHFGNNLSIVYPPNESIIFIPKKLDEEFSSVELVASNLNSDSEVFWFLNNKYINTTQQSHQTFAELNEGKYALEVHDALGQSRQVNFEVKRRD